MASWGAEQQKKHAWSLLYPALGLLICPLSMILSLEQSLGWGSWLAVGCSDH